MKIPYNYHPTGMERYSLNDISDKYMCNGEHLNREDKLKTKLSDTYDCAMDEIKPKCEPVPVETLNNLGISDSLDNQNYIYEDLSENKFGINRFYRPFKQSPKRENENDPSFKYQNLTNHLSPNERISFYNNEVSSLKPKYEFYNSQNEDFPSPSLQRLYYSPSPTRMNDSHPFTNSSPDSLAGAYNNSLDSDYNYSQKSASYSNEYSHSSSPYYTQLEPRGSTPSSLDADQSEYYSNFIDTEEPLDLRTFPELFRQHQDLEETEPLQLTIDEQTCDGEPSWLKKIRTGTRSRVRSPKSWEFLVRLLQDPQSNPSMIKWEDRESGTFRLVNKEEIARIWGTRSSKTKLQGVSYDNFARNLRYHYKTKMMVPVSEKHLVYKFGEKILERIKNGDFME